MVNIFYPSEQQQQQQPGYLDVVLPGFIPGSSNDDFVLTFSNNGKLNPPGTLSIKSAIVSSDSNQIAFNRLKQFRSLL